MYGEAYLKWQEGCAKERRLKNAHRKIERLTRKLSERLALYDMEIVIPAISNILRKYPVGFRIAWVPDQVCTDD